MSPRPMRARRERIGSLARSPLLRMSFLLCLAPAPALASPPLIRHAGIECLPQNEFAEITAAIDPAPEIRSAKVYFRSERYPEFYYVEMKKAEGRFRAYLPKPARETRRVIYYIEAIDGTFSGSRTQEYASEVLGSSECRRRIPAVAWFTGDSPAILVGATHAGAAALPPGFQAAGISGFISSAGVASAAGGGIGAGTAVAAAAGAAAATGFLVKKKGDSPTSPQAASPPRSSAPSSTTSSGTTTIRVTTSVPATSTSTTSPASTTTTTPTGPGTSTTSSGSTTTSPGTTTSPSTTTAVVSITACFRPSDADGPAGCAVFFDASCSGGNPVSYTWRFIDSPPVTATLFTPFTTYDWSSDPACGTPFSRQVRLTVTAADGSTNTIQKIVDPTSPDGTGLRTLDSSGIEGAFTSTLLVPAGKNRIEGRIGIDGKRFSITNDLGPHRHSFTTRPGSVVVEGALIRTDANEVFWRFDFSDSPHFDPGSLRVTRGVVALLDARSVTFRLAGTPGERIEFRLRLSR